MTQGYPVNGSYTGAVVYSTAVEAVEAVLSRARSACPLPEAGEVFAVQALALAGQFDHEAAEGHTIRLVAVSGELRQVLSELRAEVASDDGDEWDADAELARLTRSGPSLGDSA